VQVPLLWDKHQGVIVNNESGDLVRMLSSAFNDYAAHPSLDLCPPSLSPLINRVNDWIYWGVSEGVYACAFARSQQAYGEGVKAVFLTLDRAEALLATQRYLAGTRFTEADVRLFQTLVRFDEVRHTHESCGSRLSHFMGL
jgi:putative glutathione S-transferase